jgi:hypothetical protein
MVVSALVDPDRTSIAAAEYRTLIGARPIVVSFITVAELRYGALKARGANCVDARSSATSRNSSSFSLTTSWCACAPSCEHAASSTVMRLATRSTKPTDGSLPPRCAWAFRRFPTTASTDASRDSPSSRGDAHHAELLQLDHNLYPCEVTPSAGTQSQRCFPTRPRPGASPPSGERAHSGGRRSKWTARMLDTAIDSVGRGCLRLEP